MVYTLTSGQGIGLNTRLNGVFIRLLVGFVYAIMLTNMPLEGLPDRHNYIAMASESSLFYLIRSFNEGFGALLFNEPLWRLLNAGLSIIFEPGSIVRGMVFFNSFVASYVVLEKTKLNPMWGLVILFSPVFLINQAIQIRQGLATAIFLYSFYYCRGQKKLYLYVLTPFIHSSFFFVAFIILFRRLSVRLKLPIFSQLIAWGVFSVFIGLFSMMLSGALGARQADRYTEAADVSGVGFIFWIFVLFIMFVSGPSWIKRNWFSVYILIIYLGSYWFLPVVARVLESGLVLVLLSVGELKGLKRYTSYFLVSLFLYSAYLMGSEWLLFWI
jgi:hypothetical protein